MNKFLLLAIVLFASFSTFAQHAHEYAPLAEHEFKYKNWTFKDVQSGADVDLRSSLKGKKLVMVLYFAPWCPNWQYEAPVAQRLYEKYKKDGFEIIGVSEYGSTDEVKKGLTDLKVTFPVVVESDSKTLKEKTTHYDYRKLTGDTRSWGSPWNIFIEPALVKKDGDVIAAKSSVVNGELIEADVEFFIRTKLGLGPEDKKTATMNVDTKTTEVCEDKPLSNLVKP